MKNVLSKLMGRFTNKIITDIDTSSASRERNIVMRLSTGNVRLQFGMYKTEEDVARDKANILKHNFI